MKKDILGYSAGIAAGVSYGLNTLFAKQLFEEGVNVMSMLFFRYAIAVVLMLFWIMLKKESLRIKKNQILWMVLLGLLFAYSSLGLFASYEYIPAGLATSIVYLYPVFTSVLMIMLGKRPSFASWVAITGTVIGVYLICSPSGETGLNLAGIALAASSALSYAIYLVIVNNTNRIKDITPHTITFYALVTGTVLFFVLASVQGVDMMYGISGFSSWVNLAGLAVFPTMIAMLALAVSTRSIGATKTAVMGVFEPITSILIGLLLYNEALTLNVSLGIAISVASVLFMICFKARKQ